MATSPSPSERPVPVERFKPTGGQYLGYAGLVAAAVALGYVIWSVHTVTGLRIGLGAVFFAAVVWVTQIRPRATAYPRHVVLKNSVRDAHVPLNRVEEVGVGQTLNVWAGGHRYVCIGIGQSVREELRARRRRDATQAGRTGRLSELTAMAERASTNERAVSYPNFVVTRIEELVDEAKRETRGEPLEEPRQVVAWVEVGVLAVTGLAFLISLFV